MMGVGRRMISGVIDLLDFGMVMMLLHGTVRSACFGNELAGGNRL